MKIRKKLEINNYIDINTKTRIIKYLNVGSLKRLASLIKEKIQVKTKMLGNKKNTTATDTEKNTFNYKINICRNLTYF